MSLGRTRVGIEESRPLSPGPRCPWGRRFSCAIPYPIDKGLRQVALSYIFLFGNPVGLRLDALFGLFEFLVTGFAEGYTLTGI